MNDNPKPISDAELVGMMQRNQKALREQIEQLEAELSRLRAWQEPVAWLIDWPDEPELGHYFSDEQNEHARSRPLYTTPQPSAVPDALREAVEYLDSNPFNEIGAGSILHRAMRDAIESATATATGDAGTLYVTHRPLIHNAINLLRMRRPVPPDVERVAAGLEAMLAGLPTPAGEPSATWLEVAAAAEPRPAEVCDVCEGKGYVNVGDGDAQVDCPFCDLQARQEGWKV